MSRGELAAMTALSMLGSLRRALGDLDRITGWARVFGMVNSAPGFDAPARRHQRLLAECILAAFGPEAGRHARSAVGVAGLPLRHSRSR